MITRWLRKTTGGDPAGGLLYDSAKLSAGATLAFKLDEGSGRAVIAPVTHARGGTPWPTRRFLIHDIWLRSWFGRRFDDLGCHCFQLHRGRLLFFFLQQVSYSRPSAVRETPCTGVEKPRLQKR
jgi:hypothetical protein